MATYDLASTTPSGLAINDIINCSYSGAEKSITLPAGKYKLEVWGARGGGYQDGNTSAGYGGKGGYSCGVLQLQSNITLYLYSGGIGSVGYGSTQAGGFNGGGSSYGSSSSEPGCGGGGASDIRIGSTSLYARVIVAGGGGGGGEDSSDTVGYGGGTSGGASGYDSSTATQTAAGTGASFGTGRSTGYADGGGGGGGWYGGGSGYSSSAGSDSQGGGGGSGYVYTSSTASNYPSGCLLNSAYYLTDATTYAGNTSFTGPDGSSETGHDGEGYCRITVIELYTSFALNVNIGNTWKEVDSAYVNIGGIWKEIEGVWANIGGSWKESG